MLLFKTALKNILGSGLRTWLNVAVLSFTFVMMVWYMGLIDGWIQESRNETIAWEMGGGQYWMPVYDKYDAFSLPDAHAPVPEAFQEGILSDELAEVLIVQGTIFPQGRMINVQLKGIDPGQNVVALPSHLLEHASGEVCAIVGERMAKAAGLSEGEYVMVRWRDRNGAFDAREIRIAGIFETKVASVDNGQLWLSLGALREMTVMPGEATYLVQSVASERSGDNGGWVHKDMAFLMADLDEMMQANQMELVIVFVILLAVSLLAVFDTQTLAIFRRQKEIGTYVAMGMTKGRVANLFTLEGTMYSFLAILTGVVWGAPLLLWYQYTGMRMPDMITDSGLAIGNVIYPEYTLQSVLTCAVVIVSSSALISYLPARKIMKGDIVNALKGKIS